ncbi:peptide ABC transporter substrate-binding protein [Zongyangia hominis]|uniref:Peptide ABC transporter substrate-binding protein n=1 Tax=Zongyangia hominis TaxID=2763677 RepID=A0A926EEJ6_9FIRM|nr:peptide ABC transporter substrate-binding protein [Zongyangia hominis]MBC8570282.1 peptide ABC transporter substrate-binding protein [Zongyangia hominis]
MFKKIIVLILSAALLCAPLTGCSRDKTAGQIFRYDIVAEPTNLDPQLAGDHESMLVIENAFEGLLTLDEDNQIAQGVAERYEVSSDNLIYTFHLRDDAQWSDGTPVTAADFQFALQRIVDPNTHSPHAHSFFCVKNAEAIYNGAAQMDALGVQVIDAHTLEVTLGYPNPYFPTLMASSAAVPCNEKFFLSTKGRYGLDADMLLYNGPFFIRKWSHDEYVSLRQNSHYMSEKPAIAGGVTFYIKEALDLNRLLDGNIDAMPVTADQLEAVTKKGLSYDSFEDTVWVLAFNGKNEVFQNANIRKAISYAMNRSTCIEVLPSYMSFADALIPNAVNMLDRSYRSVAGKDLMYGYDPAAAKSCLNAGLAELGLEKLPKTNIIYPDEPPHNLALSLMQKNWKDDLSSYLNIEPLPLSEVSEKVESGSFEMALIPLKAGYDAPDSLLNNFLATSKQNYYGYQSAGFTSALNAALESTDIVSKANAFAQAEQLLLNDCIVVPMYFQTSSYATGEEVTGISFSPFSGQIHFKYARKPA